MTSGCSLTSTMSLRLASRYASIDAAVDVARCVTFETARSVRRARVVETSAMFTAMIGISAITRSITKIPAPRVGNWRFRLPVPRRGRVDAAVCFIGREYIPYIGAETPPAPYLGGHSTCRAGALGA